MEKATEIAKRSGLGRKDAVRVALGKATVQQVLKEMMFDERVDGLVRKHGFDRATACNVVAGSVDLETALLLKGLRECTAWVPDRSVLVDVKRAGLEAVFYVYGRAPFTASVVGLDKFDCVLSESGRDPNRLQKHDILAVCLPEHQAQIDESRGVDAEVAAKKLGPSTSYRDRFRSRKRVLFRHHRDEIRTRLVLRDGSVLEGDVDWFGKWEFGLKLPSGALVTVFRHALFSLGPAEANEGRRRANGRPAKEARRKGAPKKRKRS